MKQKQKQVANTKGAANAKIKPPQADGASPDEKADTAEKATANLDDAKKANDGDAEAKAVLLKAQTPAVKKDAEAHLKDAKEDKKEVYKALSKTKKGHGKAIGKGKGRNVKGTNDNGDNDDEEVD